MAKRRVSLGDEGPVLVFGGAGFLGRYLALAAAEAGASVTVVDDLSCANSTFDCPPLAHPRIVCRTGSVFDAGLVAELVALHPVVCHLASVVGVEETISRPLETMENLQGTINVSRHLTERHVALFTSSADVYGLHSKLYKRAMREDDLLLLEDAGVNRWVYAHVKCLEENLFVNCAARTTVIRVFNSYGMGMDYPAPKRVLPHFIDAVLKRHPLRLSGDGSQQRSFCHVDDTIAGMMLALGHAATLEPRASETFNIGSAEPISIVELAHVVNAAAVEAGLLREPLPVTPEAFTYSQSFDDSWDRCPDIEKARRLLGFVPRVQLAAGLRNLLPAYRELLQDARLTAA